MLRRFSAHFTPYKVATAPNFKIKLDTPCISTSIQKGTSTLPRNRRKEILILRGSLNKFLGVGANKRCKLLPARK